jgi:hypothetical protein
MNLSLIFSHCFVFGHEDPVKVWSEGKLSFQCPTCHQDLGEVLPGQKFIKRKVKAKRKSKKPASVLRLTQKQA